MKIGDGHLPTGRRKSLAKSPNKGLAFAEALIEELVLAGIRHACISPGSRSALLAIAAQNHPELSCWIHIDERSSGFFGLGLAKAALSPVILICTSGTAAANFFPAVAEAHYANVPLVVLTADRPPELLDWGAGQTIDQTRLFGTHVRWFFQATTPESNGEMLRYARSLGSRAVSSAVGPPSGPVHLNLPFREPLDPTPVVADRLGDLEQSDPLAARGRGARPYVSVRPAERLPSRELSESMADTIAAHRRGVFACGPYPPGDALPAALTRLARVAAWPVLADATSQLRFAPESAHAPIISTSDLFLRNRALAEALRPEVIVCAGAPPTSKAFRLWLEGHREAAVLLVDPTDHWNDPSYLAREIVRSHPVPLFEATATLLEARRGVRGVDGWLETWLEADCIAKETVGDALASSNALIEPQVLREAVDLSPEGTALFVSSGMPVRVLDGFVSASAKRHHVHCNRGANGIDGIISTALGVSAGLSLSAAKAKHSVLLTGDLAFLHDLGGLLAARRYDLRLTIVVLNNDGGGIFSFLNVANFEKEAHFETLFTAPHGLTLKHAAAICGASYERTNTLASFRRAFVAARETEGTKIIEVPITRARNVAGIRRIAARVSAAMDDLA